MTGRQGDDAEDDDSQAEYPAYGVDYYQVFPLLDHLAVDQVGVDFLVLLAYLGGQARLVVVQRARGRIVYPRTDAQLQVAYVLRPSEGFLNCMPARGGHLQEMLIILWIIAIGDPGHYAIYGSVDGTDDDAQLHQHEQPGAVGLQHRTVDDVEDQQ